MIFEPLKEDRREKVEEFTMKGVTIRNWGYVTQYGDCGKGLCQSRKRVWTFIYQQADETKASLLSECVTHITVSEGYVHLDAKPTLNICRILDSWCVRNVLNVVFKYFISQSYK